ncbi:MAG: hypothetical protein H6930_06090 [Rhodoferax sp.]|nr:hypothetical protein [Rhodoferax sp.]
MAAKGLGARIEALETANGISEEPRCGVVQMLPGETVDEAKARVGPGAWLIVPGVIHDAAAWTAMVQRQGGTK